MKEYLQKIWRTTELRKKILFILFWIIVFRLVSHIPVPWIDTAALKLIFDSSSMLWVFSALTWWNMHNFSVVMMWLSPYINASIIIQLLTVVIPSLERLNKDEWEEWRKKLNSYTRWLTLPLALLQSYWMIALMNMSAKSKGLSLIDISNPSVIIPVMIIVAFWTVFLMWLWEIMTEKWIWNWTSMIIFAWIVAWMPPVIWNIIWISTIDKTKLFPFILFTIITILLLVVIVIFSEAQRNISITYASAWNKASKW
jgi:preprotein translocase subunit SecY